MNILMVDWEVTISNKGNAFDRTNKAVVLGLKWLDKPPTVYWWDDNGLLQIVQDEIDKSDLIVAFNAKFDLHWCRRVGLDISKIKVWDAQLAEFLFSNQKTPYNSLNDAAEKYGFPKKVDVIKTEYWDKGIDTDQIPRDILGHYLAWANSEEEMSDLYLTEAVFKKQRELFSTEAKNKYNLFKLQCLDLLVLEEMEYNGIVFSVGKARERAKEIDEDLKNIGYNLSDYVGNILFNPSSNDHVSVLLYGGVIEEDVRIPVGVFKSGAKIGQTRYKVIKKQYELPRLVEPLKGTETKYKKQTLPDGTKVDITDSPTHWKVNETILRKLKLNKKAKEIVNLLNKHSELEKLKNTYLEGYSDLIDKMNWPKDKIHGNLNQCVVVTGRLSSTKPNLQNSDPETKRFMRSRYG